MFNIYMRDIGSVEPTQYLPGAANLALGSAAKLTGGKLAKCAAGEKPTHIVLGPQRRDGRIPALRVQPTTVFQTTSTAAVPAPGVSVQLHTDAAQVTAASGGAFVVDYTENKAGGLVRGRFA